jgi:hypothetical protein
MKLSARLVLILAVIAGILEYLNATTFGITGVWHSVITYGLFVISSLGVTAAVGSQLGVDIEEILHVTPAGVAALTTVAVIVGGAVQTFAISGVAKGVILGVIAFITTIFGPGVGTPSAPTTATA